MSMRSATSSRPRAARACTTATPTEDVTPNGARRLGIERLGEVGIVGGGVLLDVAELRGGPLEVGECDVVLVRNGGGARNTYQRGTGLHASCLPWLRARGVAVLSSDSDSDVHPPLAGFARWTEPMHMVLIPYLGMPILDNTDLDALAGACAEEGRWAFFVSVAPCVSKAPRAHRSIRSRSSDSANSARACGRRRRRRA